MSSVVDKVLNNNQLDHKFRRGFAKLMEFKAASRKLNRAGYNLYLINPDGKFNQKTSYYAVEDKDNTELVLDGNIFSGDNIKDFVKKNMNNNRIVIYEPGVTLRDIFEKVGVKYD